jgi:hypothetical protein
MGDMNTTIKKANAAQEGAIRHKSVTGTKIKMRFAIENARYSPLPGEAT